MSTGQQLFVEDLRVGLVYESGTYVVSADEIREFAQRYDPQPFHTDEEVAKATFFEGLAASGWHTAAISMRLLVESVRMGGGIIGAGSEVSWPRPTRPGDTLRVVSTIVEIMPSKTKPNRAIVKVQSDTLNQNQELCQRSVARLIAFRRT